SMSDVSDIPKRGNLNYVYLVGGVGLFVLLIACINFMNLATARSAGRAKEVGLRKSMGSSRSKLALQFLAESFIYVFIALVIALFAFYFLLPSFNLLSGKVLSFNTLLKAEVITSIAVVYILVSLISGSYPAFYLTAFKPIEVLRGNLRSGIKTKGLRASLVVFQFTVSIALIICTLIVFDQIDFLINKDIGLDNKNVLVIENTSRLGSNQDAFYDAINSHSGVVKASYIDYYFPYQYNATSLRAAGTTRDLLFIYYKTDYNHKDVLKLQMKEGRFFSPDYPSDSMACIVNEAAVKELGWTDPLSERFEINGPETEYINVVGVVKDFNFESSKWKAKPLVIGLLKKSNHLLVRYNPKSYENPQEVVASMGNTWKQFAPNEPYEYAFLDQSFAQVYEEDRQLGKVFTVMSAIAIFVACLGLLGLAAFTAEQRTREIGIRKVMGASVMSVNLLLSKEFMLLVGISFVIASTVAWFAMYSWLGGFVYRVEPSLLTFIVAGLLAALVAWLTIGYHFNKASRSNPADTLRYD
ncbi:MAG: FtsX-like permease family protein, partial [Cyclobacteriaceae bacterium]|nr:FtsX-like permease family protein [Cyclobacteriaceae bacterium]